MDKTETIIEPKVVFVSKRCSDYEEDCKDVHDHFSCWMGGVYKTGCGKMVETDRADGLCPFIHKTN